MTTIQNLGPEAQAGGLPEEQSELEFLLEQFPHWDLSELQDIVQMFVAQAKEGLEPETLTLFSFDFGEVICHFDGTGGLSFDPRSTLNRQVLELAKCLQVSLGDRFSITEPSEMVS
jgi:hypothetical protein